MKVDGVRFRELREARLMTVEEMSMKSKVSGSTIRKIEAGGSGETREGVLRKLASSMDMKPEEFSKAVKTTSWSKPEVTVEEE